MTVEELEGLFATWKECPPMRITLARIGAALGAPPPEAEEAERRPATPDEIAALVASANRGR